MVSEREAQRELAVIALELVAIEERLERLANSLPVPANQVDMLEHRAPYDVATELAGTIECVVGDEIRPAIEYLEGAARVTAEELRRRFDRDRL
jgi:hypothetical protein